MREYFRGLCAISRKDFRGFFAGPFFYVLCGLAFIILSGNFFHGTANFVQQVRGGAMMAALGGGAQQFNIREFLFINHYVMYFWILIFIVSAMAIKFLAEEKRNHTFDLLWTAPVRPMQIVVGKFLAAAAAVLILTALTFLYPIATWMFSSLEWGAMLATFLGLFLLGAMFTSAGMFVSSLTSSSVLTVVGTVVVFFAMLLVGVMGNAFDGVWWAQEFFRYISIGTHIEAFLKGTLKLSSIVFLITFTMFWLVLSEGVLKFSAVTLSDKKLRVSSKILLGVAFLCLIVPGVFWAIVKVWLPWLWAPVAVAVLAFACIVVVERQYLQAFFSSRSASKDLNVGTSLILTVLLLGFINYIVAKNDKTWDLTEGQVNTLSSQTKNILNSLAEPATIVALFQDDESLRQLEQHLRPLVDQYRDSSPLIRYERYDLMKHPRLAEEYGLSSGEGLSLFVTYQDRKERISVLDENGITTSLAKVLDTTARTIYLVTGHGEFESTGQGRQSISYLTQKLEGQRYSLRPLDLVTTQEMPKDGAFVAIWGPETQFSEHEIQLLRDYIRGGGRVFIAADPLERHDLAQLTKTFGIQFENTIIYSQQLPTPTVALGVPQPTGHEIVSTLPGNTPVVLYNASPLDQVSDMTDSPWKFTALVATGFQEGAPMSRQGVMTLAAIAEKKSTITESEKESGKVEEMSGLLVVGDSNFLTDQFITQAGNESFVMNLIYYMSRNKQVMGVQPKRAVGTAFEPKWDWWAPVFYIVISLLPIFFLGGGVTVWLRRKAA
jgi:ABC-2 type transport system permease protein